MSIYEWLFPCIRPLPTELAHQLGHWTLQLPIPWGGSPPKDPFVWKGVRFRNRVGIAAGFDKNGMVLPGIARMGVGFVEVGTILTEPWSGNPRPRMSRLPEERAVWNRLGFTSDGLEPVAQRLGEFQRRDRSGLVIACNIAPHPRTVKTAGDDPNFLDRAREELACLARGLHAEADLFVVNLSSPNTRGLRDLLYGPGFRDELIEPLGEEIRALDVAAGKTDRTPLLVKLPPEDADGKPWTPDSIAACAGPLSQPGACDGFVAVNTSIGLARDRSLSPDPQLPGGLSGAPLLPLAVAGVKMLGELRREDQLLIGVGGVDRPEDAVALHRAGADLVEVYTGMIYHGPGFPADCARALAGVG
ncbi:MAG: dihydroorotate dehydrogenase 2 [bacterium]|nr:dihydroorotate dehydrogenase 2 [bacterium]